MTTITQRIGFLLLLTISADQSTLAQNVHRDGEDVRRSLAKYVSALPSNSPSHISHKEIGAFFLRFVDFGCALCLNNFLDLCDSLELNASRFGERRVVLVFQRDDNEESYQLTTLKQWSHACNLSYSISLASAEFFRSHGIEYSSVVLVDSADSVKFVERIPLTSEQQREFIRVLFRLGR